MEKISFSWLQYFEIFNICHWCSGPTQKDSKMTIVKRMVL